MSVSLIRLFSMAILMFLFAFTATALAQNAVVPDQTNALDLFRPIYEAFAKGHHLEAGMLALVFVAALIKRYTPESFPRAYKFVHSDPGGTLLILVGSFGTAMATTAAGGMGFSWAMVKTASLIAVGAAGGYSILKKLLVEPFLRPYYKKAPSWLKPIIGSVLWIFDRPNPVTTAEVAGQKAVEAAPAKGITINIREVE